MLRNRKKTFIYRIIAIFTCAFPLLLNTSALKSSSKSFKVDFPFEERRRKHYDWKLFLSDDDDPYRQINFTENVPNIESPEVSTDAGSSDLKDPQNPILTNASHPENQRRYEHEYNMIETMANQTGWKGSLGNGTRMYNGSRVAKDEKPMEYKNLSVLGKPPPALSSGRINIREWYEKGEAMEEITPIDQELDATLGKEGKESLRAKMQSVKEKLIESGFADEKYVNDSEVSPPHSYSRSPSPREFSPEELKAKLKELQDTVAMELADKVAKKRMVRGELSTTGWSQGFLSSGLIGDAQKGENSARRRTRRARNAIPGFGFETPKAPPPQSTFSQETPRIIEDISDDDNPPRIDTVKDVSIDESEEQVLLQSHNVIQEPLLELQSPSRPNSFASSDEDGI